MTELPSGIRRRYHIKVGGLVFLLVAVFIGVAAFNSQANLLFWTFGLMMGALITSGIISGAMLAGLRVRRLLPDHGAVDEPLIILRQRRHNHLGPLLAHFLRDLRQPLLEKARCIRFL